MNQPGQGHLEVRVIHFYTVKSVILFCQHKLVCFFMKNA